MPDNWVPYIQDAITNIRTFYSNVRQIVLQPVVGGPNKQTCFLSGTPVRASVNHPIVDQAIAMVVGGDVVSGMSPEVATCSDYQDTLGHLLDGAPTNAVSTAIGQFYLSFTTPGDVNGDWLVDLFDLQHLVNVLLGLETNARADVNGDTRIDVLDLQRLVNVLLGV